MKIWTDAIDPAGYLDPRYTIDIDNSSPELRWEDAPEQTAGFVLMAEDPDAPGGVFTHWVVYNIPPSILHLPAGIPPQDSLPNGIRQGLNSFNKLGYAGPCPPRGDRAHRYVFKLFAVRRMPDFPPRATRETVLSKLQEVMLASAETTGYYARHLEKMAS